MPDERMEFRISFLQNLTPEDGQESIKKIQAIGDAMPSGGGIKIIKVPGLTRFENPFPAWLIEEIKKLLPAIKYDQFNFYFKLICKDEDEARVVEKKYFEWFVETGNKNPEKQSELMCLKYVITEYSERYLDDQELNSY